MKRVQYLKPESKPKRRYWKAVSYIIAVKIGPSKAMLGAKAQTVTGRALGIRRDGQRFFAELDLPWLWTKRYDWRKVAKARLDTFLDLRCTCSAKGKEIIRCDWHLDPKTGIMRQWAMEDAMSDNRTRKVIDSIPVYDVHPGPIAPYRVLFKDWPWVMFDPNLNENFCDVCKARQWACSDSETRMFVNDHSHCFGRVHGTYEKSRAACNLSTYGEAAQALMGKLQEAEEAYSKVSRAYSIARSHDAWGLLPERMSVDEAPRLLTEYADDRALQAATFHTPTYLKAPNGTAVDVSQPSLPEKLDAINGKTGEKCSGS